MSSQEDNGGIEYIDDEDGNLYGPGTETGNQLAIANYYPPGGATSAHAIPLLSESAIEDAELAQDVNATNQQALTRLPKLKKPKQRKQSSGPKSRPAFVMKLWTMVNDPENEKLIKWAPDGKSFIVSNRESFMKYILPKYFKHNNFASFVRQLNMYGWHKVQDVTHESIHSSGSQAAQETLQFENLNFIQGREDLLDNIVRNKSSKDDEEVDFGILVNELESIKMNQLAIVEDLRRIRNDNQLLWEENFSTREKHDKQSQAIDKIMRFLHQVYGNGGNRLEPANNFNFGDLVQATNMGDMQPTNVKPPQKQQQDLGPKQATVDAIVNPEDEFANHFHKPRLMLMQDPQRPSIEELPTSPTQAATNPNPLIQEIIDNDVSNQTSLAPSPRSLFPELHPQQHPQQQHNDTSSATSSTNTNLNAPAIVSDPQFIDHLEENISRQGQSIQHVNDWIAKLTASDQANDLADLEQYYALPKGSGDNGNGNASFNVEDFLAPTPSEVDPGDALSTPGQTVRTDEPLSGTKRDASVGQIDEIIEDQNPRKKRR